jgi:hypothetical protein
VTAVAVDVLANSAPLEQNVRHESQHVVGGNARAWKRSHTRSPHRRIGL